MKLLVKRVVFILSMISGTIAWSSTAPRISEEALYITKKVEKVGLANIFHHFYNSKDFLKKIVQKVEKVGLANIFHDSSRFGSPNRGKRWPGQLFPPFPRISEAVFGIKEMVEKLVLDNIFHDLGLQNGLSRGKSCPGQLFPLFPRISEEVCFFTKMVEKVGLDNFCHHFYDSKDCLRNS